ncbi:hypothetical protein SSX86_025907 [Deinandra increscens subsp. villosa]|uniref:Uncharacterized protein n=1 Tax=Deinandra increscens subsp. villosa TaxID=3103831 RepID=A0AAP0CH69_9ASTR
MFRSMSTRKTHCGYGQLFDDGDNRRSSSSEPKMLRSITLPSNFFGDHPFKLALDRKPARKPAKGDVVDKQVKKASISGTFSVLQLVQIGFLHIN